MSHTRPFPSSVFTASMAKEVLILGNYGVEYQPIVHLKSGTVLGYEALSRFTYEGRAIPPNVFFDALHEDRALFCKAEATLKGFQFAHRPSEGTLYVNIDPHILEDEHASKAVLACLNQQRDFVVELVENSYTTLNAKEIFDVFLSQNYTLAVDDFLQENSMLSLYLLKACHVLKLDRGIIQELRHDGAFSSIIQGLIAFAHAKGKTVIFEGVETEEDLRFAETLECDSVQGFLFRPLFITHFNAY